MTAPEIRHTSMFYAEMHLTSLPPTRTLSKPPEPPADTHPFVFSRASEGVISRVAPPPEILLIRQTHTVTHNFEIEGNIIQKRVLLTVIFNM